jgi:hypothetical protein
MRLEPIIYLLWSELAYCLADKIPTPSILGCEYFFIYDARRHVASTTSGDDYFIAWGFVLLEDMDMVFLIPSVFEYGRSSHESCGTRSDDGYGFHVWSILILSAF